MKREQFVPWLSPYSVQNNKTETIQFILISYVSFTPRQIHWIQRNDFWFTTL